MPEYLPDLQSLTARSQRLLVQFLEVDLDLAFTFLQTAGLEAGVDIAHYHQAMGRAQTALDSIRHFQGRITDPDQSRRIRDRANQLEAAIAAQQASK
jgi:hypothetical protein